MQFLGKLWKMWENIEILNLSQQKEEVTIWCQNQIIILQSFTQNIKMKKKTQILMNKPVYLGLSILEISKILMYEFWYDYVKPKYGEKTKLCYMDTAIIVYIKADYIYKDIVDDVETRFDNSNYELDRSLPKGRNKKVIELMKDKLYVSIMTKFVGLRAKTYGYLQWSVS